jgi:phosphoribosylglycinamide formyltransferase 1
MRDLWGVLISGNGSTLQALLDCRELIDIGLVISSKPKAYGLQRAIRAGVATAVIPEQLRGKFVSHASAEDWILSSLRDRGITKLFLAGFMRILSGKFIQKFSGDIFNIHPSLLPKYKGLGALEQAINAGETKVGATVHRVTEGVDEGEVILQRAFTLPYPSKLHPLNDLWLHVQEQRLLRDALRKVLWLDQRML